MIFPKVYTLHMFTWILLTLFGQKGDSRLILPGHCHFMLTFFFYAQKPPSFKPHFDITPGWAAVKYVTFIGICWFYPCKFSWMCCTSVVYWIVWMCIWRGFFLEQLKIFFLCVTTSSISSKLRTARLSTR